MIGVNFNIEPSLESTIISAIHFVTMKSKLSQLTCILIALFFTIGGAHAGGVRVVVGFHGKTDAGVFHRLGGMASTELKALGAVAGTVPAGQLKALRKVPGVAYVEEDLVREASFEPNDTYYNTTFSKRNEKRGYNDQRDDFALINAQLAWDTSKGAGVRVAVLDTGIDLTHPDFSGQVLATRNFTDTGGSTDVTDTEGHGSHTAGTVAAKTNNGLGVAGTAGEATLAVGKVLGPQGGYDSWVANGMLWAADPNGGNASVISMSLGGEGSSTVLTNAALTAWNAGALSVAASGNDGVDGSNHYPSADPNVMAVAAVSETGAWASFSNYGAILEIAAPGVSVLSTYDGGSYGWASGTSMACPHVAGVAALIWSKYPTRDNSFVHGQLVAGGGLTVTAPDGASVPILDAAAALVVATPLPTVLITAPFPNDTIKGLQTISADASSPNGEVVYVEFFVDGVSLGQVDTAPYEASWDSSEGADGSHTLSATVRDVIDETGSDVIVVITDNVDDPPAVAITSPSPGELASGSLSITADASDDLELSSVEFFVDNEPVGSDTIAPYEVTWNSSGAPDGQHNIFAIATDSSNQSTVSDSVLITVDNTLSSLAVTGIDPSTISPGTTIDVTIAGSGFEAGATVFAENGSGPQPAFSNVTVVGSSTISATLRLKNGGSRRNRSWDVRVTNTSDGSSAVLAGGLTVTP